MIAFSDDTESINPSGQDLLPHLETLSQNAANSVYVVSGKTEADLDKWSKSNTHSFGIGAEYGAFVQQPSDTSWKSTATSFTTEKKPTNWRRLITKLFQKYVKKVLGSYITYSKAMITLDFNKSFDSDKV